MEKILCMLFKNVTLLTNNGFAENLLSAVAEKHWKYIYFGRTEQTEHLSICLTITENMKLAVMTLSFM